MSYVLHQILICLKIKQNYHTLFLKLVVKELGQHLAIQSKNEWSVSPPKNLVLGNRSRRDLIASGARRAHATKTKIDVSRKVGWKDMV